MSQERVMQHVRWLDQHYRTGPLHVEDAIVDVVGETVGLLIAENDVYISLAMERFGHEGSYRHVVCIPKVCILERRNLTWREQ
jgi:hypothetical protein